MSLYAKDPLFTAILSGDTERIEALKSQGAALSDEVKNALSINRLSHLENGEALGAVTCDFQCAVRAMSAEDFIRTIRALRNEIGEPLFFMPAIWADIKKIMYEDGVWECVLDCFDNKMNKAKTMRGIIKRGRADILAICAEHGWLSQPKKLDDMTEYAAENNKTECTAFLLDFKNRAADAAAERAKAEKKLERELNADPNSVSELKKSWRFKKLDDGSLEITCYKGDRTEVTVPERIGKNTVTAIGAGAFSANTMCAARTSESICDFRRMITKITLPKTVTCIDKQAFCECYSLREINLPIGLAEIHYQAFFACISLESLKLSGGVGFIGKSAFNNCPNLTVFVRRGSYAERYCAENGIKFEVG